MLKHLSLILLLLVSCSTPVKQGQGDGQHNGPKALAAPYVLMISLDGYRYDYNEKYKPPFLTKFAREGASLKSLIPTFPTKTFPNHYSLVTGLHPGKHGIVANHFYAPDLKLTYTLSDRNAVTNADFYSGIPLWNLARQNEMLSATYFWPGSEAPIGGMWPNYWEVYNHGTPHDERIAKVIEWLKLPEASRPHLLTLYFHDVDSAGHGFGPNSPEVAAAIAKVDASVETLVTGIQKLNLPVNIIITSDHGMTETKRETAVLLNTAFESSARKELLARFMRIGSGPMVHFYYQGDEALRASSVKELKQILKTEFAAIKTYDQSDAPKRFKLQGNVRMGDLFMVAPMGVFAGMKGDRLLGGNHGYDNAEGLEMHGIFYAQGPAFKSKTQIPSTSNVNIYPLVAHILGLKYSHAIDGDLKPVKGLLKK